MTEELLCRSQPYRAGLASVVLLCSLNPLLDCVTHGGGYVVNPVWSKAVLQVHCQWVLPGCGRLATVCALTGAIWNELQSICRWLLLMLGLEVPRRGQAVIQGWLPLLLSLGPLTKRYRACQVQDVACLEFVNV